MQMMFGIGQELVWCFMVIIENESKVIGLGSIGKYMEQLINCCKTDVQRCLADSSYSDDDDDV